MKNFMETAIPDNFAKALAQEKQYELSASHADKIATILFVATSECLKNLKSKEKPAVFKFIDIRGELIAAAIVSYHANEDENQPGNWTYVWTFDPADIPDNATVVDITQSMTHNYFVSVAGSKYHMSFEGERAIIELVNTMLIYISKWLQDNAKEGETIGVTLDGIFEARAEVEDGEVVKALEVIGETKAIIKNDNDLAVK